MSKWTQLQELAVTPLISRDGEVAFIAAARDAIPELIAENGELRKSNEILAGKLTIEREFNRSADAATDALNKTCAAKDAEIARLNASVGRWVGAAAEVAVSTRHAVEKWGCDECADLIWEARVVDADTPIPNRASDVTDFAFTYEHDGTLSLRAAVMQALGAASACWGDLSGAGVFRCEEAVDIGEALIEFIESEAPRG